MLAVLAVAGCTSQDGLAATANNGTGSTSVDERIVEISAESRGETVVFAGVEERGNPVFLDGERLELNQLTDLTNALDRALAD